MRQTTRSIVLIMLVCNENFPTIEILMNLHFEKELISEEIYYLLFVNFGTLTFSPIWKVAVVYYKTNSTSTIPLFVSVQFGRIY